MPIVYHRQTGEAREGFLRRGYQARQFFSHRIYRIPKAGPDAAQLFPRMVAEGRAPIFWTLTLHAEDEATRDLPSPLFFDDELVWHRQHYGQPGHVAYATLAADDSDLYVLNLVSDVVQRQSRVPSLRSRIQNRFNGWAHLLLNAILCFAIEHQLTRVLLPRSGFVLRYADRSRSPRTPLFERVYDAAVRDHFLVTSQGDWWLMQVTRNRDLAIPSVRGTDTRKRDRLVCIVHDTERGLGHLDVDPAFAEVAGRVSDRHLDEMLRIESGAGWRATYSVVGALWNEVAPRAKARGHALCFHSFDHDCGRDGDQLRRCRELDFRVRGYRPPRSVLTPETEPARFRRLGFDWIASSARSLGVEMPTVRDQIAKIPIVLDDFALHNRGQRYEDWKRWALATVDDREVLVIGLHDCYASHWIDDYGGFLDALAARGSPATLDDLANRLLLEACD